LLDRTAGTRGFPRSRPCRSLIISRKNSKNSKNSEKADPGPAELGPDPWPLSDKLPRFSV
jgi:hypothetical protein